MSAMGFPVDRLPFSVWRVIYEPKPHAAQNHVRCAAEFDSADAALDGAERYAENYVATVYEGTISWRQLTRVLPEHPER